MMSSYLEYNYSLSLTSQFYFCGIPFRLDTSPKCNLNCYYCFAMSRGGRRTSMRLLVSIQRLRRLFGKVFEEGRLCGLNSEILARKVPLHFGGLSDPFSNKVTSKVSKSILDLLGYYDYPVVLSTKNSEELLKDKTIEVLKKVRKLIIQISIPSRRKKFWEAAEPNVPMPNKRIKAIKTLSEEGFHCICRIQPLFQTELNNVNNELIPALAEAGSHHIVIEHLKLPVERNRKSFDFMLEKMNWDAYDSYRKRGMVLVGREWLLTNKAKLNNLQCIVETVHKYINPYPLSRPFFPLYKV